MKKNRPRSLSACIWSTGSVFLFSVIFFLLYWQSQCRLFQLSGFFALMLGLVNLILLLFRFEPASIAPSPSSDEPSEPLPPEPAEETAEAQADEAAVQEENLPSTQTEETPPPKKKGRLFRKKEEKKAKKPRDPAELYAALSRIYRPVQLLLLAEALLVCFILFGYYLSIPFPAETVAYWHLAAVAILFVGAIILEKACRHVESEDDTFCAMILRNACVFFSLVKVILVFLALSLTLRLLNLGDIQIYLVYGLTILFYYVGAMIVLSLTVRTLRKELGTAPGLVILLPFLGSDRKELSVLTFLEENTGVTFRSLWSLKYVRKVLPYAVLGAALLFWVSTGLVYVESRQQGAVYRFGKLQEDILSPGIHLTLPYPFDKTEIYDTETVNKMTVGYKSAENNDNVWTEGQESEYQLLLGSGNELVSINLRIEYRIADLHRYLTATSNPEGLLEGLAYELVTDRTICTDLDQIIAANRETFAVTFREELIAMLAERDTGLEVVNVILESIHPPVEVADVYQAFIGAGIDAEKMILEAQGASAVRIAEAQSSYYEIVNEAYVDYCGKKATALTEVSEFMAAVEASNEYPSEYSYYRYLNAVCSAYQSAKLIILGNGVDGSRLYYGNFATE